MTKICETWVILLRIFFVKNRKTVLKKDLILINNLQFIQKLFLKRTQNIYNDNSFFAIAMLILNFKFSYWKKLFYLWMETFITFQLVVINVFIFVYKVLYAKCAIGLLYIMEAISLLLHKRVVYYLLTILRLMLSIWEFFKWRKK